MLDKNVTKPNIYLLQNITLSRTLVTRDVLRNINERRGWMNNLANRIKECRSKLHLSQEYVANHMAMNRATITQIELGKRKVTAEELAKFGTLFGMSADGLLHGENTEMPATIFARSFSELDEKDQDEIMSLMQFKKLMKEQRRVNE